MSVQKKTQKERIIDYLGKHGMIDRKIAYDLLGIFELPARICDLQRDGYEFEKNIKHGKSKWGYHFHNTEYRLKTYLKTKKEQEEDE